MERKNHHMRSINAIQIRKKFGEIIDRIVKTKEPVTVSRANKPLVVILPYDQYAPFHASEERRARLRKASEAMDAWAEQNAQALKGLDAVSLIREQRDR